MKLSFLNSKGFSVEINRVIDPKRKLYEIRLIKENEYVKSFCTQECLEENIEVVYQDLFLKFADMRKRPFKDSKTNYNCYNCLATDHVKRYGDKLICEKCAIFYDD